MTISLPYQNICYTESITQKQQSLRRSRIILSAMLTYYLIVFLILTHSACSFFQFSSAQHSLIGFPGSSEVKASASNAGDLGSIPGSGRSPGEGHGNPLQYSRLENPMDRGIWRAEIHGGHKESDTTERLHLTLP